MEKIIPGYEGEFFEWLVEQRLKALLVTPGLRREGVWQQEPEGYDDIQFYNEQGYVDLVIETEKNYPEFDFYKMAQEYVSFSDLEDYRKNKH